MYVRITLSLLIFFCQLYIVFFHFCTYLEMYRPTWLLYLGDACVFHKKNHHYTYMYISDSNFCLSQWSNVCSCLCTHQRMYWHHSCAPCASGVWISWILVFRCRHSAVVVHICMDTESFLVILAVIIFFLGYVFRSGFQQGYAVDSLLKLDLIRDHRVRTKPA